MRISVPKRTAVTPRQIRGGIWPRLHCLEVSKARVAIGVPVVLLREDLAKPIVKVCLQERLPSRSVVVVIFLRKHSAGGMGRDDGNDAFFDATLANNVGNLGGYVDVGGPSCLRLHLNLSFVDAHP